MPRQREGLKHRKNRGSANLKHLSHDKVPATTGLVREVREELLAETRSIRHDMNAGFKKVEGKFKEVDARFDKVDARFDKVDARFDSMEAKIEKTLSIAHGTKVLMEEQRAENKVVLDGLKTIIERQDRNDEEHREFRQTLQLLLRTKEVRPH